MKIAIAALLGGTPEKTGSTGMLSAKTFGLTLENRLAQRDPAELSSSSELLTVNLANVLADAVEAPERHSPAEGGVSERYDDNVIPDAAFMSSDGLMYPISTPWQIQELVSQNGRLPGPDTVSKEGAGKALLTSVAINERPRVNVQPFIRHTATVTSEGEGNDVTASVSLNIAPSRGTAEVTMIASDAMLPDPSLVHSAAVVRSSPVHSSTVPPSARMTELPDTPQWKEAVSQNIAFFAREGIHNASIHLHPEELGSLQISLRVHQEQAHIHIVSEHALVRQAMEHALPQLRAAMAESGLQLSQASVGAEGSSAWTGRRGSIHRVSSRMASQAKIA